jgi:hypothetical protein
VPDLYREVKTGLVSLPGSGGRAAEPIQTQGLAQRLANRRAAQQPALFDFVTRQQPVTIADIKPE